MERKLYHRMGVWVSILLPVFIVVVRIQDDFGASVSHNLSVSAQIVSPPTKTNNVVSSKFRESISQFRRKQQQQQQPIIQQSIVSSIDSSNEQQVIEQQQQQQLQQNQIVEQQQINSKSQLAIEQSYDSQQHESIYGSVKGTPGVDFPNYSAIPNTRFSCDSVPFEPGMYADESTGCQVYHLCYQGRRESFLCGIGTVFNQAILNCDFWHSVDCSKSSQYYSLNAEFGKSSPEPGGDSNSISQSSLQIPSRSIVQQQLQIRSQQSSVTVPRLPATIVQNQENYHTVVQESSGGKISPPNRLRTSFIQSQQQQQSSFGGTKSIPAVQDFRSVNLQRTSNVLSPARKVSQLNSNINNVVQQSIASAESSPMRSLARGGVKSASRAAQQIDSSLVNNSNELTKSTARGRQTDNSIVEGTKQRTINGITSGASRQEAKQSKKAVSSIKSGDNLNPSPGGDDVWKPYFKTKGGGIRAPAPNGGQSEIKPAAPVHRGPSSTVSPEVKETSASPSSETDMLPSTLAQPDHEPTFSSEQSPPTTQATSEEVPSVPKGDAPPTTVTSTESPASAESPAVIESGVGSDLSTTTPAEPSPASEPSTTETTEKTETTPPTIVPEAASTEADATTTTPAPPSTDAAPQSESSVADSEAQTSTTTAEPPAVNTPAATAADQTTTPSEAVAPSTESSMDESTQAPEQPEQEKKKKRGTVATGVEYADKVPKVAAKRSAQRTNSSSVEYAKPAPKSET